MARTECPECRHVAAVKRERLGRRVRCPNCEHGFEADWNSWGTQIARQVTDRFLRENFPA